jgi:hypothetical protein
MMLTKVRIPYLLGQSPTPAPDYIDIENTSIFTRKFSTSLNRSMVRRKFSMSWQTNSSRMERSRA